MVSTRSRTPSEGKRYADRSNVEKITLRSCVDQPGPVVGEGTLRDLVAEANVQIPDQGILASDCRQRDEMFPSI